MSSKKNTVKRSKDSLVVSLQELTGGFMFLVNQAPIVVTVINEKGEIMYQSPNIKNILGYEAQDRIGKNFIKSKNIHPDDLIIKQRLLKKALKEPNTNFMDELRLKHKNGTWCWLESIFNNQINNPKVRGIVVISYDINKRKKLEIQKNEFLSIASHELKTPITAIRAYGQLLIKKNEKNDIKLGFLEKIVSQTDKLTSLIDDLLDMSKLQEKKFSVHRKPFQMRLLIKKIIEDFQYFSDSHTIELAGNTNAFVIGDETRITQVVMNLLTNAIKYSPNSPLIQIHIQRKGKYVITSVIDKGEGIPSNKQKFVFDRFFKVDDGHTRPASTGLGLYIASEIIKLHSGKIWLESTKGKGSTFFFSLPVAVKS